MAKYFEPSEKCAVDFAGVHFRSPFGVGAVGRPAGRDITPEEHADVLLKHAIEGGAGYIYMPVLSYAKKESLEKVIEAAKGRKEVKPKHFPSERNMPAYTKRNPYGLMGVISLNTWPCLDIIENNDKDVEEKLRILEIIQKKKPEDVKIIGNVRGYGSIPDTYVDGAKFWADQGVDMIEMVWNCPAILGMNGAVEEWETGVFSSGWPSSTMGQLPEFLKKIHAEIAKEVSVPTGAKLTPEIGFPAIVKMAKELRDAGAKFVTLAGGQITVAPPDIYDDGKSTLPFADGNAFSAAFGHWLIASSYKNVAAIGRFVPELAIAGSGGVVTPEQSVEMMMLGAGLVEITTAVLEQGRGILRRCNTFLDKYMKETGYESVNDIVGRAQKHMMYLDEVNMHANEIVQKTDMDKCVNCGICADHICVCRTMVDGKLVVNTDNCTGCGWCLSSCRKDAISLVRK